MNYTQEILGDVVRTSRKSKNLSQEELAERIGACKRTIIDIENNTGNPKFEILYALVRELDLPLCKVFYQEMPDNIKLKNEIIQELSDCSEHEMKIMLSVIKSLRQCLRQD